MSQKIAEERIRTLFELAEQRSGEERNDSVELANRYVELARNIGMSYNVPVPSELKKRMCSECHSFLVPGKNSQVRINSKKNNINYRCESCGNVDKYGF